MAKTAKKKPDPSTNPRSRAAKRATSPSIDVDRSIKDAPRASDATPVLGVSQGSGISKKKRARQMTRGQRIRQEKGLARAEAVTDQMEQKVQSAKTRLKTRQQRKAEWDDINSATVDHQHKATKAPGRAAMPDKDRDRDQENIQSKDNVDMNGTTVGVSTSGNVNLARNRNYVPSAAEVPPSTVAEDEADLIT